MVASRETLLTTSQSFIRVMSGGTTEQVMSIRSPRCIQRTLPTSLQASIMNNEQFAAFYASISKDFKDFQLRMVPGTEGPIIDVDARRVVLHLRSHAEGPNGVYENEYIVVLRMSEDGRLLDEVVEFADSGYIRDYFQTKAV